MGDYHSYDNKIDPGSDRRAGRAGRRRRHIAVLFAGLVIVMVTAWILTGMLQKPEPTSLPGGSRSQPVQTLPPEDGGPGESVAGSVWNIPAPLQQQTAAVTPDYRMLALPENGRVDMSYFNTVTFVGDSITQGLQMYTQGIPNAHYCAYKSIGPRSIYDGSVWPRLDGEKEVPMEALAASQPDNVYVLLGANILGNTQDEVLIAYYREMLRQMKAALHPAVQYYVQSITPVRPDSKFNMDRIRALNNALAQLAYEEGAYFVDLNEPLAGDDGYLREEFGGYDGIHMTPAGYAAWVDYLSTHTAYDPRSPYIKGTAPYHTPAPAET